MNGLCKRQISSFVLPLYVCLCSLKPLIFPIVRFSDGRALMNEIINFKCYANKPVKKSRWNDYFRQQNEHWRELLTVVGIIFLRFLCAFPLPTSFQWIIFTEQVNKLLKVGDFRSEELRVQHAEDSINGFMVNSSWERLFCDLCSKSCKIVDFKWNEWDIFLELRVRFWLADFWANSKK